MKHQSKMSVGTINIFCSTVCVCRWLTQRTLRKKKKTTPKKDTNEIFWQYPKLFFGDTLTHARHTEKRRRNTEQTAQQMKNASTSSEYVKAYWRGRWNKRRRRGLKKGYHPRRIERRKKSLAFMLFSTFSLFCTPPPPLAVTLLIFEFGVYRV